jgi:hypothetical protein
MTNLLRQSATMTTNISTGGHEYGSLARGKHVKV